MQLSLLRQGDWAGIVTMAIGLSALQTVLEEGNKDDWFQSPFIFNLGIVAAVFLAAFVAIELTVSKPLVNLRLLARRNFGIGVLVNTLVGFALFGSVYILPQYLGQVQRYYYRVMNCRPRAVARSSAGSKGSAAGGASGRPRGDGARSRSRPGCAAPGAREELRGR